MDANLEEPLQMDQLAVYAGRSRRQIERLFKEQLGTTPQRYYLELAPRNLQRRWGGLPPSQVGLIRSKRQWQFRRAPPIHHQHLPGDEGR